jgi:hypothetical protein
MADDTSTRDYDWETLVRKVEGESFDDPPVAYQFSNGRTFKSPGEFGGVYVPGDLP